VRSLWCVICLLLIRRVQSPENHPPLTQAHKNSHARTHTHIRTCTCTCKTHIQTHALSYAIPDYVEVPITAEEIEARGRYDLIKGSAVNPVCVCALPSLAAILP
jgi:hypothetical protein